MESSLGWKGVMRPSTGHSLLLLLVGGMAGHWARPLAAQGPLSLDSRPPGTTPKPFAPNLVSTEAWEAAGTFSPEGTEFFFTRRSTHEGTANRIMHMRWEDGRWTEPFRASFSVEAVEFEPHVTPDGSRVYFNSRRPDPRTGGQRKVWFAERIGEGWSEARLLTDEVNRLSPMYVTATRDGTLYFGAMEGRRFGIFRAERRGGGFADPEYLPPEVNGLTGASHPFVAPDESYLIFDAYTGELGESDLYVSARGPDGSWGDAVKLGPEINATRTEIAASVSPDGRYLFFHRMGDIYWVSARVLETYGVDPGGS